MRCRLKKLVGKGTLFNIVLLLCLFCGGNTIEAKTQVKAKLSAASVKVGQRIQIKTKNSKVSFVSSNSVIASVDAKGVVTGKKAGKVSISVKRTGYKTKKITLTVKKSTRKPATLPVSFSEVDMVQKDGSVYVTNRSKKGKIKKLVYYYRWVEWETVEPEPQTQTGPAASGSAIETEQAVSGSAIEPVPQKVTRTMTLTVQNIAAGKTAEVTCSDYGQWKSAVASHTPWKIEMYTGKALYRWIPEQNAYTFRWGTPDTVAPKFTGLLKRKSSSGNGDIYRVYYSDRKDSYNYRQFVSAEDDRDGKVKVQVDKSKINWNREGVYKIYFRATDRGGNTAKTWAKVQVLRPGSAESAADRVLKSITRKGWSATKKAKAIYTYVRKNSSYVQNSAHIHWRKAALSGLRYQSGDCYTYYAMCRLLLTRAGIPNIMIKRYPTPGGQRHFWNLTYIQGGWYHFDTTPRNRGGRFCLWTDAQMWAYSSGYTFRFNQSLYPKRAKRKIA